MEKTFAKAEELAGTIKDYVNTRIESLKFSAAEKSSAIMANILAAVAVMLFAMLFIIFFGIALALLLGTWMASVWASFLVVAGLFLLMGIIIWAGREKIIRLPVMNSLVKQLFENDKENEED